MSDQPAPSNTERLAECPTFAERGTHDASCYVSVCKTELAAARAEAERLREALELDKSVVTALRGFLQAYQHASVADEEGLAPLNDWRAAWDACDVAASEATAALVSRDAALAEAAPEETP